MPARPAMSADRVYFINEAYQRAHRGFRPGLQGNPQTRAGRPFRPLRGMQCYRQSCFSRAPPGPQNCQFRRPDVVTNAIAIPFCSSNRRMIAACVREGSTSTTVQIAALGAKQ